MIGRKLLEHTFARRPGILNVLHSAYLVRATSQTTETELKTIENYARGSHVAFEIGSFQGVSAARIAAALTQDGVLYCVDPWPAPEGKANFCYSIFRRHLRRTGMAEKIRTVRTFSRGAGCSIPDHCEFAFVDGDHSWEGIATDWSLVRRKLRIGGIVCLHDSLVPPEEPWRQLESVRFYEKVVSNDADFRTIDSIHSLAVLKRIESSGNGSEEPMASPLPDSYGESREMTPSRAARFEI